MARLTDPKFKGGQGPGAAKPLVKSQPAPGLHRRALEVAVVLVMAAMVMVLFWVIGFAAQSRSLSADDGASTRHEVTRVMNTNPEQTQ